MPTEAQNPWQIAATDGSRHLSMASYGIAKTATGKVYRSYLDFYLYDILKENKFIGANEKIGQLPHLHFSSDIEDNIFLNPSLEVLANNAQHFFNIWTRNFLAYRAPSEAFKSTKSYVVTSLGYASTKQGPELHTPVGEVLLKISNGLNHVWKYSPIELGLYNQWISRDGQLGEDAVKAKCLGALGHVKVARSSLYNLIAADERFASAQKAYHEDPNDNNTLMNYYYQITNYISAGLGTALSFILLAEIQSRANSKGDTNTLKNLAIMALDYNAAAIATGIANLSAEALELATNLILEYLYKKPEAAPVDNDQKPHKPTNLKWELSDPEKCYFWSKAAIEESPKTNELQNSNIITVDLSNLEFDNSDATQLVKFTYDHKTYIAKEMIDENWLPPISVGIYTGEFNPNIDVSTLLQQVTTIAIEIAIPSGTISDLPYID